jgi:hypothetical protein
LRYETAPIIQDLVKKASVFVKMSQNGASLDVLRCPTPAGAEFALLADARSLHPQDKKENPRHEGSHHH